MVVLDDVWDYMDEYVKRAFKSVALESDRIRTSRLLGALATFADVDAAAKIIKDIQDSAGIELVRPKTVVEDAGGSPESVTLSPCVKETLQFFKMHGIRDITVAKLAMRLLQLGHGDTVLALEKQDRLGEYIAQLKALQDESIDSA